MGDEVIEEGAPVAASWQEQIEAWKQEGGVVINGVRYVPASRLDDAFELGRLKENQANTFYRIALREIAEAFHYRRFAFNERAVKEFVAFMAGYMAALKEAWRAAMKPEEERE